MSSVIKALQRWAYTQPMADAVIGAELSLSYFELATLVEQTAQQLAARDIRVLGMLCDNGPAWAVIDLAAQLAGITCVPLPLFFSNAQIEHAVRDAGIELIFTDTPARVQGGSITPAAEINRSLGDAIRYAWVRLANRQAASLRRGIAKITYTSGTTGAPKGVCLSQQAMDKVAAALANAVGLQTQTRHLAVLPLATLLENIGGLYAPLLAGAASHLLPMQQLGAQGSADWNIAQLYGAIRETQAHTLILVPQLLQDLVQYLETTQLHLPDLQFVAVGGAPVSPLLLQRAAQLPLPVHEGYGLSECASVVAVNTPQHHRPGSAGRLLPHVELAFAEDGEILVHGAAFDGYLHEGAARQFGPVATGDCGYLDKDGYLFLTARKKNMFITAYGRNVAPEWVERELVLQPAILQAALFGEARPWNVALIVPAPGSDAQTIEAAIHIVNQALPDYARIRKWLRSDEPFGVRNDELTGTGRLRRSVILKRYGARIDSLYASTENPQRKLA